MENSRLSKYSAKIKDVYIELKGYEFFHSPYYEQKGSKRFIGREKVIKRIISILKNTHIKSGAYLITGFRGMGKTSVIREAIYEYNDFCEENYVKKEEIAPIIKRVISYILCLCFLLFPSTKDPSLLFISGIIGFFFLILLLITILTRFYQEVHIISNTLWNVFKIIIILSLFTGIVFDIYFIEKNIIIWNNIFDKNILTHIRDISKSLTLVSDIKDVSIFRVVVGVFISYVILSSLLFIKDLLSQIIKSFLRLILKGNNGTEKYEKFEINLSQDSLNEIDILRRITINIQEYWLKNRHNFSTTPFDRRIFFLGHFILSKINKLKKKDTIPTYESVLHKLNRLLNRISGEVTLQKEQQISSSTVTLLSGGFAKIMSPSNSRSSKDGVSYPVANSKEIEDHLIAILEDIDEIRKSRKECDIRQFAFIIDELDKIEPHGAINFQEKESSGLLTNVNGDILDTNKFRQRQEAVAGLLANLKGFLNVVRVKFFFIGGREMYDAYLADIADRDSFYSSIFNDVIYVESFFKDSLEEVPGKGGVTQMTEKYLCNIILNNVKEEVIKDDIHEEKINLQRIFERLSDKNISNVKDNILYIKKNELELEDNNNFTTTELQRQAYKIIFTLQNYIIYLTYRSNGTPKKLTTLIEKLIVNGPSSLKKNNRGLKKEKSLNINKLFFKDNLVVLHDNKKDIDNIDLSERLFLKFSFDFQYEIGLTSNLYRPYLISNSRNLKSLGDKLLFSSSFIIDHILKFHSFGFSWRNLELIPEIVLINREPNLRKFIEDLMRFYSSNYIEDTVSGIFDYKFRSIVRKELIYLSKISDLGSAAFNFTLDESFSTKRHYRKKLIELESHYSKYTPLKDDNQFIHSICFVQTILGDLHFYDKEYDEAIVFYTESIQALRLPKAVTDRFITRHQFLLWLRNQLKLGLALEKIRAFDSAFSLYKTLILDTERYLKKVVSQEEKENEKLDIEVSEDHRTIHLISMPFVAFLAVTEKSRTDGITYASLRRNREEFTRIIAPSELNKKDQQNQSITAEKQKIIQESDKKRIILDEYRRNFLKADYYNNVGSLLFYKNCQFTNFFNEDSKKKSYWLEAFEDSRKSIFRQQNKIYDQTKHREYDFFPSLVSFNYYWNSLYFLVKEHKARIIKKINKKDITINKEGIPLQENLLAICAGYLLPECIDMVGSKRLYYIANVVSKIGDSILASLKKEKFVLPTNKFNLTDIGNKVKENDNRSNNINKFREIVGSSLYTAETVLYIYKLAASLFKRSGHNSYYASHLIKILYTIKDLIEFNKKTLDISKIGLHIFIDSSTTTIVIKDNALSPDTNKDNQSTNDQEITKLFFKQLEKIAEVIFKITSWNNEIANRPQILKYREIFNTLHNKKIGRDILYNNISNISDNREVLILVEEIKMKLDANNLDNFTLSKNIVSPYNTMSNRYLRMLELKYRTERCYYIVKNILQSEEFFSKKRFFNNNYENEKFKKENELVIEIKKDLKTVLKQNTKGLSISEVIQFLIKEALFCLGELMKMFKLYDPGYLIGYSFIAVAHHRMGDWCNAYEHYKHILHYSTSSCYLKFLKEQEKLSSYKSSNKLKKLDPIKKGIKKEPYTKKENNHKKEMDDYEKDLKKMLGSERLAYLESKNHYESAIQYYYKVIQMHSDGKAYNDKLHEIYMLEDDYNDISVHYTISSERLRINTGNIKKKINKINEELEKYKSKLYTYSSYISLENEDKDEDNCTSLDNIVIKNYLDFFNEKLD